MCLECVLGCVGCAFVGFSLIFFSFLLGVLCFFLVVLWSALVFLRFSVGVPMVFRWLSFGFLCFAGPFKAFVCFFVILWR